MGLLSHRRRSGVQRLLIIIAVDRDVQCAVATFRRRSIFLIRTFLLCISQLVRSAPNSIRKVRCESR